MTAFDLITVTVLDDLAKTLSHLRPWANEIEGSDHGTLITMLKMWCLLPRKTQKIPPRSNNETLPIGAATSLVIKLLKMTTRKYELKIGVESQRAV